MQVTHRDHEQSTVQDVPRATAQPGRSTLTDDLAGDEDRPLFDDEAAWEAVGDDMDAAPDAALAAGGAEAAGGGETVEHGDAEQDGEGGGESADLTAVARALESDGDDAAPREPTTSNQGSTAQGPTAQGPTVKAAAARQDRVFTHRHQWGGYDIRVTDSEVRVQTRVRMKLAKKVNGAEGAAVAQTATDSFRRHFDNKFSLKDKGGKVRPLRMKAVITNSRPHATVTLHPGRGRDNSENWHVQGDAITRAHELGHVMGLPDEYKGNNGGSPVHTDHSLMGNYYAEGKAQAELRPRHGQAFARAISSATNRQFQAQRRRGGR